MVQTANEIFRDYVTAGMPSSGVNEVDKAAAREWGTYLEDKVTLIPTTTANLPDSTGRRYVTEAEKSLLVSGTLSGTYAATTLAGLNAYVSVPVGVLGIVTDDGANTGRYQRGTSSWTRIGDTIEQIVAAGAPKHYLPAQETILATGAGPAVAPFGLRNTAAGTTALGAVTGGSDNTALGAAALGAVTTASGLTGIGSYSLWQATGLNNTALGASAGSRITTGDTTIFIGYGAGSGASQGQDVTDGIAIGVNSYVASTSIVIGNNVGTTDPRRIVLGGTEQSQLDLFGGKFARFEPAKDNLFLGRAGGTTPLIDGGANIGIGGESLAALTGAVGSAPSGWIGIGYKTFNEVTGVDPAAGGNNIAIGSYSGKKAQFLSDTVLIGANTGENLLGTAGVPVVGVTAIGHMALQNATLASNSTGIGDSALRNANGAANVGIGYGSLHDNAAGVQNTFAGTNSGRYLTGGSYNVGIGFAAFGSGAAALGNYNTGAGHAVGQSLTTGGTNTFLGALAGTNASQLATASGSIAIGYGTYTDASNQMVLGSASITDTVLHGAVRLGRDGTTVSARSISAPNVSGASNTGAAALSINGGRGTGTGAGGDIIFNVAPEGASGSTQNALTEAMRITRVGKVNFANHIEVAASYGLFFSGRSAITSPADGQLQLRDNSGAITALLTLSATNVALNKPVSATTEFQISGTKVVGARDTGWAAMTGTSNKATVYDTSSVTLPQLAGRIMALQATLTAHGLIGS